jgi:hypothetical protein
MSSTLSTQVSGVSGVFLKMSYLELIKAPQRGVDIIIELGSTPTYRRHTYCPLWRKAGNTYSS